MDVFLKKGKFGLYLTWGENKKSIQSNIDEENFTIDNAIQIIEKLNENIIREINNDSSIRNGKYGPYLYYKTASMNKPKFIKLKDFKNDYKTCDLKILEEYIKKY